MPVSAAAQGSAYLLTHRSWMSRIGTGFRKCSFSRPRRRVTTRFASSSTFRCFITPKRDIGSRRSSAVSVCPSSWKSRSSSARRVGSASALNTSSIDTAYVTGWSHVNHGLARTATSKVAGVTVEPPFRRIALVAHPTRPVDGALATLTAWSRERGLPVVQLPNRGATRRHVAEAGQVEGGDLVVALGGDGTVLS